MISLEKLKISTPLQKLHKNMGDSGKLIVAKFAQSPINRQIWSHLQKRPFFRVGRCPVREMAFPRQRKMKPSN